MCRIRNLRNKIVGTLSSAALIMLSFQKPNWNVLLCLSLSFASERPPQSSVEHIVQVLQLKVSPEINFASSLFISKHFT